MMRSITASMGEGEEYFTAVTQRSVRSRPRHDFLPMKILRRQLKQGQWIIARESLHRKMTHPASCIISPLWLDEQGGISRAAGDPKLSALVFHQVKSLLSTHFITDYFLWGLIWPKLVASGMGFVKCNWTVTSTLIRTRRIWMPVWFFFKYLATKSILRS